MTRLPDQPFSKLSPTALAVATVWVGVCSTATAAEDDADFEVDPVVVSATRTETPASELTRSVTVVDRAEIEKQSEIDRSSVGEILSKTVPGFSPSTESMSDFGQTLRGRNFLTLIDGVPQTMVLRNGRRSLNAIDASAIERIEVVRGGTAAYGFGATGGLVNIITRRPEPGEMNVHAEIGGGVSTTHPDDSFRWHTNQTLSGAEGNVDYLFGGSYADRGGYFDAEGDRIPPDPLGAQGGLADSHQYNLLGKTGVNFDGGRQRIELTANYFDMKQDSDWAGLATGGNAETGEKSEPTRGNINVKDPGTENTLLNAKYSNADLMGSDLQTQVYYGNLLTRFAKFPGFAQRQYKSEKIGARATVDTPVNAGDYGFNVIWGADYLHADTRSEALDGVIGTPDMEQSAVAGFGELELPVGNWGMVRAGVRQEFISLEVGDGINANDERVEGGTLNWSETLYNVSAIAFVTQRTELFASFSQGFSLADFGRAVSDGTATDAEDVKSEAQKVDNYEIGVRRRSELWEASVAAFYSTSEKGSSFNQDLELQKRPEKIYGVEMTGTVRPTQRTRLGGTASWMEGRVDTDDDGDYDADLSSDRIPPLKLTAFGEYQVYRWWQARLQGLYSGHRDPDSEAFYGQEVEPYTLVDLYSAFDTGYGQVRVGVENLLNEEYFPVINQAANTSYAYSMGPGRTVSLTYAVDW
ncbi:TonB-dependent receptor [Ectothiorhodospiraceae bacterium WFHF3C12]|nr:TonB-dependent receptor [Ectothiorhodospiraceae bacterium WFHF3C12]